MTRLRLPFAVLWSLLIAAPMLLASSGGPPTDPDEPLRIFVRAGPKTHGPGEHEHELFLAEWIPLLESRGARAEGALRFPDDAELERADVLVMYAANAGSIHGAERTRLERFLARGGGIVVIHDAVCGDAPDWFAGVVGGAWEHGKAQWHVGELGLHLTHVPHPITDGAASFDLVDELYHQLTMAPGARVLANSFHTPFDVAPQMWTLEQHGYRAFVSIPGHYHTTFSHPAYRTLLLRGIAWAGGRDANLLVSAEEVAALRYPPGGPTRPEAAHEHLVAHPDVRVELVAAEPLVVNPISLEWDGAGRMWVALTPGYPFKQESSGIPAHDRIVILADDDGDGRMDRATPFHVGLDLVSSLVLHRDGAIVSQAPDILFLRDTDGDDRADRVETLFTGFGYGDTHATLSNLRWGPDGWIYATQGYSGNASHVRGADGRDFGRIGNGVLRFRPDGSAIEMVVSYGSNTWGLDFAPDGELFFTMANGAHLRHVVLPDAILGRGRIGRPRGWADIADHDRVFPIVRHTRPPYVQIDFVGGFTAASGCLIYDGGSWPAEFHGNHFVCEPTVNLVHRDLVRAEGVSFRASKPRQEEFLAGRDLWFRPVHARTGPDGHVYVLDFYNQAVIHNDTRGPEHGPTNAAVRPDRDHLHGRIWRLVHDGARTQAAPNLAAANAAQRAEALGHPAGWVRGTARRLLVEDGQTQAVRNRLAAGPRDPLVRLEALRALAQLGAVEEPLLAAALVDPDRSVVRGALRLAAELEQPGKEVRARVLDAAARAGSRGRLLALVAMGGFRPAPGETRTLVDLYPRLEDDHSRSAAFVALAREPLDALLALVGHAQRPHLVPGGIAGGEPPEPELLEPLVAALCERVARSGSPRDRAALVVDFAATARTSAPLARLALSALVAAATPPPGDEPALTEALGDLLEAHDLELAIGALPLAERWGGAALAEPVAKFAARLRRTLEDPDQPGELRRDCLRTLLAIPGQREAAIVAGAELLEAWLAPEVRLGAIELLGACDEPRAAAALADAWPSLTGPARDAAFAALVQRPSSTAVLLDALAAGTVAAHDLGPQRLHRLRNHPQPELAARASALLDTALAPVDDTLAQTLARLTPIVERGGDALRGREVFVQNCSTCHSLNGEGAAVGPALDGMGAHGPAALLPFILDPNRAVEAAYVEYVASTLDGRVFGGLLAQETTDRIVLKGADGEVEIHREDLDVLRSTGRSLMPAGFESLGDEALRDLVAYLCQGFEAFRVLDLDGLCTSSTAHALYDARDPNTYTFTHYGVHEVEGVPFHVLDPARTSNGYNAIVLRGGLAPDWKTHTLAQRVEVPVGFALRRLHLLGAVGAWAFPIRRDHQPAMYLTYRYTDGEEERVTLTDGVEISDWIGRYDVPGSKYVRGVLAPGSRGQLRYLSLTPSRAVPIESLVLESPGNHIAPTFLALTAQIGDDPAGDAPPNPLLGARSLLVGGGSSHDFGRWYAGTDLEALRGIAPEPLHYTDDPEWLAGALAELRLLALSNNQPLPGEALRRGIEAHVERGGGLLLLHAATWFNWPDWPAYNRELVGGGARSHEAYGVFDVELLDAEHPVTAGLPARFEVPDELYRVELDPAGPPMRVLAVGRSRTSGETYPVLWIPTDPTRRVVALTLGHDGASHEHPAYRQLLRQAAAWLLRNE